MATARDIIKSSLRLIGAISQGENPSASELSDGLATLNDLLDSWSNEELVIPFNTTETFDLVSSQQAYTMGAGGDFDTTWPIAITQVYFKDTDNSLDTPIDILSLNDWAAISLKQTSSTVPLKVYIETGHPLKTLNFWPLPSVAKKVVIYSQKTLINFDDASDDLTLPPGFARALKYNLALELAPEYGVEASANVHNTSVMSKAAIKSRKNTNQLLTTDLGFGMGTNIVNFYTGE